MAPPACERQPVVEAVDFGLPPESLFAALCDRRGSFFLDSALPAGGLGAWSFIGFDPFLTFQASGERIALIREGSVEHRRGDALAQLSDLMARHRGRAQEHPRFPFAGGAVGYFSYEFGAALQRIRPTLPDDGAAPEVEFGFYDGVLAFESATGRSFVAGHPAGGEAPAAVVRRIIRTVREALDAGGKGGDPGASGAHGALGPDPRPQMAKAEYLRSFERIKGYIASGDIYQVNLTHRFEAPLSCHPYALYLRLRQGSPAPFACYLNTSAVQVAGSSPERFLRLQGRRIETRPIKGTRPRGATPREDARLRDQLLASAKDRAELLMIVDLERNDLGRVCEFGSIRVDELFAVESHPTVHHLVANVSGRLRDECDVFDCLRAMLPGGSITGAPKIRAMQVIGEVEASRRQLYTGAMGYLGFDGNCDLNIPIRTIFCSGGRAAYHVGGGIVWDSDPEAEYQETLDKGRAMRTALSHHG